MKFFKIAIICTMMMAMVTATASATDSAQTGAGDPVTITVVTAGLDDFAFTPSPSTLMDIRTSLLAYALTASSAKTTTDNGVVYGVVSSESPVFQTDQTADGTNIAPTDETALPAGFVDKAGNAPGGGS